MPIQVISDWLSEPGEYVVSSGERSDSRAFLVTGLSDLPGSSVRSVALNQGTIPRMWDPHPAIPDLCAKVIRARQRDKGSVVVVVDYGMPNALEMNPDETAPPQIEVGTTLQLATTERDRDGNQIVVAHNFGTASEPDVIEQVGEVEYMRPCTVVRYSRREPLSPGEKSKQYAGTLNRNPVFGDPARWWLCLRIEGSSEDGGQSYHVQYEFQRSIDGWDPVVVYWDEATGRPVRNPVWGEGIIRAEILPDMPFENLNLTV